jgi:hypothetical protein
MKYFFIILFHFSILSSYCQSIDNLLANATPVPEKKKEKEKQQKQSKEITMPVEVPAGKTPEELEKERQDSIKQVNEKWNNYLCKRISEIQQFYEDISQLDSATLTKESLDDYQIAVNSLKEKVDFKLGNDPLWKENDELDELRALFSETHARTLKKIKFWEEKIVPPKKMNKLIILGIIIVVIVVIVSVFTKLKSAYDAKKARKQTQKLIKQQQQEIEKQRLLSDESNIININ